MDTAWIGVIGVGIGALGTFAGAAYAQWRAERMRSEDRNAEEKRWREEQEIERERRLFDHKRIAYESLLKEEQSLVSALWDWVNGQSADAPPPEDATQPLFDAATTTEIYGSPRAAKAAFALAQAVDSWMAGSREDAQGVSLVKLLDAETEFKKAVREDLGLAGSLESDAKGQEPTSPA